MAGKKTDIVRTKTKVKGYKPMVINGQILAVPVTKTNKIPKDFLKAVNNARSAKARTADAKTEAKTIYNGRITQVQAKKWMSKPSKSDIKNVDAPKRK